MMPYLRFEILKNHILSGDSYLPTLCKGLSPPPEGHVASEHGSGFGGQMPGYIHKFSVVKCCLCYLNIFKFKYMK